MEKKITKISLGAKMGLISMCLAQSTNQVEQQYADDTNLNPAYHLTPEVIQELLDNDLIEDKIIDNVATAVITKKGIWFAHLGCTDALPAFDSLVKSLTPTATHYLINACIGELAKRHQTTTNEKIAIQIEGILNTVEENLLGIQVSRLGYVPEEFQFKPISQMAKDYEKVLQYNKKKVIKKTT